MNEIDEINRFKEAKVKVSAKSGPRAAPIVLPCVSFLARGPHFASLKNLKSNNQSNNNRIAT